MRRTSSFGQLAKRARDRRRAGQEDTDVEDVASTQD